MSRSKFPLSRRGRAAVALAALVASALALTSGSPAAERDGAGKTETLADIFTRKLAYTRNHPFFKELHTPHLKPFPPRPWRTAAGEFLIDESWAVRTEGRLEDPGPFAVEELVSFFQDAAGIALRTGAGGHAVVLRVSGTAADRRDAESFTLKTAREEIAIEAKSWRGVLYGVYHLEQLLLDRGAPALTPGEVARRPLYDVRMFGEVYGTFTISGLRIERPVSRDTFSALSRFGANATFTFVGLGDYLDGRVFPELANPDREKNLAELARLAATARSAGLALYLDAYNPKLPSGHPVFAAHPNARGARQHGGDIRCLCPSDPETLAFIADAWADVFRRVPALGGMVAIIGGEGFYHCYMRTGPEGPDCPRCRARSPEDVVAGLTNAVFRAIRKARPDAELLAWPYSAFVWSGDPHQLGLIAKLDPGIQIVPEIDKDHLYPKDGYVKNIWDYSIDFIGPSDRYLAMTEAARRRGLAVCCKTETAVSLEFNGVPYIPCLDRWGKRLDAIAATKPDSIYYAYDVTGFTRSRPEELAGRLSWTPSGSAAEEIRKMAVRDFGPAAADRAVTAWRFFSEAVGHMSHLTHGYYTGPSFIGPGQPLPLEERNLPTELFGKLFYLAENDASGGTSSASLSRPVYAPDIKVSPAEAADADRATALWERGVEELRLAEREVPAWRAKEYARERDLAEYFLTMLRAIGHGNRFFGLRREYSGLAKDQAATDTARARAIGLLDAMREIVAADLENARASLPFIRRLPGLDFAVRLDLDYRPLDEIVAAKIRFTEAEVLGVQFPAARARLTSRSRP